MLIGLVYAGDGEGKRFFHSVIILDNQLQCSYVLIIMSLVKDKKKDVIVRSRMNAKRKKHVEAVLQKLGMNHSEAINLFYAQVELLKGLPFDVRIPNKTTIEAMKEAEEKYDSLKSYSSAKEMFKDFDKDDN